MTVTESTNKAVIAVQKEGKRKENVASLKSLWKHDGGKNFLEREKV